jgi:hypothetical protein
MGSGRFMPAPDQLMACGGEEIGDPLMDRILYPAGCTAKFPLEDLLLVLLINMESEVSFADRTAENIHK